MKSKLILIDGITGSGKSTTAQYLGHQLKSQGYPVKWLHEEAMNHPLAYEEDVEVFRDQAHKEDFITGLLDKWADFGAQAAKEECIYIVESHLWQDSVRILYQNLLPMEEIEDFQDKIIDFIRPLNPLLIYLYQEDVPAGIRRIWKKRGLSWKQWFIESDLQTPYVKSREEANEDGVINLWKTYQDLTDVLFEKIRFKKLSLEVSKGEWENYYHHMTTFMGLKEKVTKEAVSINPAQYCGHYQRQGGKETCQIDLEKGQLLATITWPNIPLRPLEELEHGFYLVSFPVSLHFEEEVKGQFQTLRIKSEKEGLKGGLFVRIPEGEGA